MDASPPPHPLSVCNTWSLKPTAPHFIHLFLRARSVWTSENRSAVSGLRVVMPHDSFALIAFFLSLYPFSIIQPYRVQCEQQTQYSCQLDRFMRLQGIYNPPPPTEGAAVIQDHSVVAREEHGHRVPPALGAIEDFWSNYKTTPLSFRYSWNVPPQYQDLRLAHRARCLIIGLVV